ncbi:MAG: SDR family NAD(P)-dependent oxidoreductase [Clostridia bacterium]|nr:SDR family NAD(P)-dependent oxidoreductase [Clostridia bacterium]
MKRNAFISGGAKGIGRAITLALADAGFSVAIGYKTSQKQALELVEQLQSRGVNAVAVEVDCADIVSVKNAYAKLRSSLGFIDTLINNAGVSLIKPLYECTNIDYDYIMDNNLRSVFNTCSVFTPDMVSQQFGRVVNISSVWGEYGASTEVLYSASKAGVNGFTKALNGELAINGVIVNAVAPGMIDTDMNAHLSEEEKAEFLSSVALGKIGTPEQVAKVVKLLTEEDLYIAGAVIPVNGGM